MKTAQEVIDMLGSPAKAARFFSVTAPSVAEWIESGYIPEGRLIKFAARLEVETNGQFSRTDCWPNEYRLYWPELPVTQVNNAQAATKNVAS